MSLLRKSFTDAQIDAALEEAMRLGIEREPDEQDRARMQAELERWKRGEALPPEQLAQIRQTVRDFIAALVALPPRRANGKKDRAARRAARLGGVVK